jgi:hypothetical protein
MASPAPNRRVNTFHTASIRSHRQNETRPSPLHAPERLLRSTKKIQANSAANQGSVIALVDNEVSRHYMTQRKGQGIEQNPAPDWVGCLSWLVIYANSYASAKEPGSYPPNRNTARNFLVGTANPNSTDVQQSGEEAPVPDISQDSEPVRPAKRRRVAVDFENLSESFSPIQLPNKRLKRPAPGSVARRLTSPEKNARFGYRDEIEDSYEKYEDSVADSSPRVAVVIQVDSDFDPDAYTKVSAYSSQATAYLESQLSQESPCRWQGEPVNNFGKDIIPDSQDLDDSSSYEPSECETSGTAIGTRSRPVSSDLEIPALELASSSSQFSSPIPSAQPDHFKYYPGDSQISSGTSKSLPLSEAGVTALRREQSPLSERGESEELQFQTQVPVLHDYSTLAENRPFQERYVHLTRMVVSNANEL